MLTDPNFSFHCNPPRFRGIEFDGASRHCSSVSGRVLLRAQQFCWNRILAGFPLSIKMACCARFDTIVAVAGIAQQ